MSSHTTLNVRLPTSTVFDGARIVGKDAHVRFAFPAILRAGVEVRPHDDLRIEATYVREFWSIHDDIELTADDIAIEGAAGLPRRVPIPPVRIPRGFQDSDSFRLGGELSVKTWRATTVLRAGASYTTSAIPADYLSLFTIDMDKITAALGVGLHVDEHWRFDLTYARLFASSVDVSPDTAKIPRVNPLSGNAPPEAINGGRYSASADLFGVGAEYRF